MPKLSLFNSLQKIYGDDLDPLVKEVFFTQDEYICSVDLHFIDGTEACHPLNTGDYLHAMLQSSDRNSRTIRFSPTNDIVDNARDFLELDAYWHCFICERLLKEEAARVIIAMHHNHE